MTSIVSLVQNTSAPGANTAAKSHPKKPLVAVSAVEKPPTPGIPRYSIIDGCCVWHWSDELSGAEGWIVIDSPIPTVCGGGLFLHDQATLHEVRDVARSMSAKLGVSSQPQIVGAKGGIRFPPQHPQAPHVLERFIRDNSGVISQYWGTGADINTDHAVIDRHARVYCTPGTTTALDALRRSLGCIGSSPSDVAALLEEAVDGSGWSLEEYCVGYVMATTLKQLLIDAKPDLVGQVRLVMQGFGCVGATFALAAHQLGIGRVVGISSQYGFLIDNNGIDCAAIDKARRLAARGDSSQGFDPRSFEAGLGQAELQSDRYTPREAASTEEKHLGNFLARCRGEVFVPCAQRYVLTPSAVSTLARETFAHAPIGARFIIAGANNVFSSKNSLKDALRQLDTASICMLPEWVTNSGTANLFMRACSGLALKGFTASNLEASAADTQAFVRTVLARTGYKQGNHAVWQACQDLATSRRRAGSVNLLGVKRMAHITMRTPKTKRAIETITRLYNAKSNHDGSLFQLPGSDDPTFSVVEVPADAPSADVGLSLRFSVYNLGKAREALKKEGIAFQEQSLDDGSAELILDHEQAGYPMSFCQAPAQEPSDASFTASSNVLDSIVNSTFQLDHYASIMPDTAKMKMFHQRMLGFTHIRTFTVDAGSDPEGEDDGLMHVMGLPHDHQRVVILTEGLSPDSVFSKSMRRKGGGYVHHIALEVDNADAVFAEAREKGWTTTADQPSFDMATGLRQFFLKEGETGTILEFIGRGDTSKSKPPNGANPDTADVDSDTNQQQNSGGGYSGQGEFRKDNIVALARSLDI
ncbi:hypothetical protein F66182_2370 [Fusarium sp. NRRL 66182]|nr:hypothetical protein F66182_2370 [Fusarium sp. NRRL 66182]